MHLVQIFWSIRIQSPRTSLHSQYFQRVWKFDTFYVKRFICSNSYMHLKKFCEHFCVQMTTLLTVSDGISSMEIKNLCLTKKCSTKEQLFHQLQCTSWKFSRIYSFCQKLPALCQFQVFVLKIHVFSKNRKRYKGMFSCLYFCEVYSYLPPTSICCPV